MFNSDEDAFSYITQDDNEDMFFFQEELDLDSHLNEDMHHDNQNNNPNEDVHHDNQNNHPNEDVHHDNQGNHSNKDEEPPPKKIQFLPLVNANYNQAFFAAHCLSACCPNFSKIKKQCVTLSYNPSNKGLGYDQKMNRFFSMNQKHRKRKIYLSVDQIKFKDQIYAIFGKKKRFSKKILRKIHELMKNELDIPSMSREEFRRIDMYFQNFYQFKDKIIPFLKDHKEEILKCCF